VAAEREVENRQTSTAEPYTVLDVNPASVGAAMLDRVAEGQQGMPGDRFARAVDDSENAVYGEVVPSLLFRAGA